MFCKCFPSPTLTGLYGQECYSVPCVLVNLFFILKSYSLIRMNITINLPKTCPVFNTVETTKSFSSFLQCIYPLWIIIYEHQCLIVILDIHVPCAKLQMFTSLFFVTTINVLYLLTLATLTLSQFLTCTIYQLHFLCCFFVLSLLWNVSVTM